VFPDENEEHWDDDFAEEKNSAIRPVVARLDVLYELTQSYKDNSSLNPLSTAAQYKAIQDSQDLPQPETSRKENYQTSSQTTAETPRLATDNKQEQSPRSTSEVNGSSTTHKSYTSFEEFLAQQSKDEKSSTTESKNTSSSSSQQPPTSNTATVAEDLISKVNANPKTDGTTTESIKVPDQASAVEKRNGPGLDSKDDSDSSKIETITETTLAVAVIEGFLQGGPGTGLRWKIARIRDASEFQ
jgi:hypothetical protein